MAAKEGDDPHGDGRWLQMVITLVHRSLSKYVDIFSIKDSLPRPGMVNLRSYGLGTL